MLTYLQALIANNLQEVRYFRSASRLVSLKFHLDSSSEMATTPWQTSCRLALKCSDGAMSSRLLFRP